jgi:hypothetical protein
MNENEQFLVSIGFTQEEYQGKMWWVDPFFEKDDQYRYVLIVNEEPGYSVHGKSIQWIMQVIKANVDGHARTKIQQEVKEAAAREIEAALKKVVKQILK